MASPRDEKSFSPNDLIGLPRTSDLYIPACLPPERFHANLRFITDEEYKIAEEKLAGLPAGRYSKTPKNAKYKKNQTGIPFGAIKEEDGLYIIARDNVKNQQIELSKGGFGKIKVLQHHKTGPLWLLKTVIETKGEVDEKLVQEEVDKLKIYQKSPPQQARVIARRSKKTGAMKYHFLMRLEKGKDLFSYFQKFEIEAPLEIFPLIMVVATINAYKQILARGHLHCDIKLENIIFDLITGKAEFIDFGYMKKISSPNQELIENYWCGTDIYIAPEIYKKYRYSIKGEIYALGVLFQHILNHQARDGSQFNFKYYNISGFSPSFRNHPELQKFLAYMQHEDPANRPNFETVCDFFKKLLDQHIKTYPAQLEEFKKLQQAALEKEQARLTEIISKAKKENPAIPPPAEKSLAPAAKEKVLKPTSDNKKNNDAYLRCSPTAAVTNPEDPREKFKKALTDYITERKEHWKNTHCLYRGFFSRKTGIHFGYAAPVKIAAAQKMLDFLNKKPNTLAFTLEEKDALLERFSELRKIILPYKEIYSNILSSPPILPPTCRP